MSVLHSKGIKMSENRARIWDPSQLFDVSREERQRIAERAKLRSQLKAQFQRKVTNPYCGVGGYLFDPAVQRFLAMRANHFEHFRATPKSAMFGFAWVLGPFLLLWWAVDKDRKTFEHKCRTGQIAYEDRIWKNI